MRTHGWRWTIRMLGLAALACARVAAATDWSAQDYDLYPGDFNGDGKTDILYIAKDPGKVSGIALSDGSGPNIPGQSWQSNYLGISWSGKFYNVIVADFNGDGRSDIFLQSTTPGDSYVIFTGADGRITAIGQTISNSALGLTWSADQHRIIAGDFNGDHKADLFLQATSPAGLNAVVTADANGQFTSLTEIPWGDNYLGFRWSTQSALVYAGDFNGDGRADLLIQAKPTFVTIDFDVPFPVPTYPPDMNAVIFAQAGSPIFALAGVQAWSRYSNGVDWSASASTITVGDFNGDGRADVIVQAKGASGTTYLLTGNASGAVFGASGTSVSGNISLAGTTLIAAKFGGSAAALYVQAATPSGTNYVIGTVGAGFTATVQNPSLGTGVVTASAVGRTAAQFSVSPTGAATYNIPIWTPPGARDIQPHLALHYTSGGPDGVMGPGWGLVGLSMVSRCNKTWAADGVAGGVTLSATDDLCLDGNRLRTTTGYTPACGGGTTYQTEVADFSNISACGSAGNGPAYFVVQGKDGRTYNYGTSTGSQVFASGTTTPYIWGLTQILDRQGNNLVVNYVTAGTILTAASIQYTQTPATGTSYPYTVAFTYVPREGGTTPTKYVAGGTTTQSNEMKSISVSYSGTLVRQYNLGYSVSPTTLRPRLATIQECGGSAGTECLRPTTLTYQPGATGWDQYPVGIPLSAQYGFIPADLNGDGIPDAIYGKPSGNSIHWYARIGSSVNGYGLEIDTGATSQPGQVFVGAFSGKGIQEFLAPVGTTLNLYSYNGSGFTSIPTGVPLNNVQLVADYDGDGLPDLISQSGTAVVVQRNITPPGGTIAFDSTQTTVYSRPAGANYYLNGVLADFNGDGRQDLIATSCNVKGACHDFALISNGFGAPATAAPYTGGGAAAQIGDLNGDGCSDIFTQLAVYVSNCAGSFTKIPTSVPVAGSLYVQWFVVDWDGDGQTDLVYGDYATNTFMVQRSTGTGLSAPVSTGVPAAWTSSSTQSRTFFALDRNSDGQVDIAYIDTANNYVLGYYPHLGQLTPPDLAISIADGFGVSFQPSYTNLVQGEGLGSYTKGSSAVFPATDYAGPNYIVYTYQASDGLGSSYALRFTYSGARLDLQGRGFLGFGSTTTVDTRTTTFHTVTYGQDFPLIGAVTDDSYLQQDNVTLISRTHNSYMPVVLDATPNHKRSFGYLGSVAVATFEVGGPKNGRQISSIVTGYTEDNFGNVTANTSTTTDIDAAAGSAPASPFNGLQWQTNIANTITNDTSSNWCIGRPSTTTTQSIAPGQPALTRTVNHNIDYTNCRATQEVVEPGDPRLQVTTTFGFDPTGCGNTTSVSVVGLDRNGSAMPARTTTTSYGTACEMPETLTNALTQPVSTVYDYRFGVPSSAVDLNHLTTSWTYDSFGRKTQETRPDGTATTWAYSDCVSRSCWGTPNLRFLVTEQLLDTSHTVVRTSEKFYDGLDRLTFEEGNRATGTWTNHAIVYNNLGQKYRDYLPYAVSSNGFHQYAYDSVGRLMSDALYDSTGSFYRSTGVQYFGRTGTVTDPTGNMISKVTDVAGRLRRVIDPASTAVCPAGYSLCGTTKYDYDSNGNLVTLTDAIGVQSTYSYNIRGFKTGSSDADTGIWSFTPDSLNELVSQTDALGQTTTFGYDLLGRMTSRLEPESTTATQWTYGSTQSAHDIGRLHSVTKPDGYSETYSYDGVSRPSTVTYTEDGASYVYQYAYNGIGAVDTLTYPASTGSTPFALKYAYDGYGYLNQVKDANAGTTFWTLYSTNDSSLPQVELLGNGVEVVSGYTPWTNEITSRTEGTGGSTTNLQNLSYVWDVNSNLHQRQDLRQNLVEVFTPDALNRLKTVTLNGAQTLSVGYDAAGDILNKSDVGSYTYGDAHHPHAVTAAGSWTIGYDANGNMNSRAGGAITSNSYNLPTQINYNGNTDQFSYNSSHQRWKQVANYAGTVETVHYVGGLLEVVTRGTVTEYRHQIAAGTNSAIYTRRTDGTTGTFYATSDHLGSSDLILDSSGNVLARESYTPFGARRGSNWQSIPSSGDYSVFASTTRKGFTGHEMLDSVSLVHMNGRVYDPYLGRFLSADTFVQSLAAPQSINPYSYGWNDPLKYIDPTGHGIFGQIIGLIAAALIIWFAPELGLPALQTLEGAATADGWITAAVAGFVGGFVGAAVSTGSLSAAFTAGLIGAFSGAAFFEAGSFAQWASRSGAEWGTAAGVVSHAAVGCLQAVASSGNCGKGALAAAVAEAAAPLEKSASQWGGPAAGTAAAGIVGGLASRVGGGSFNDGFSVGAAGYLFNDLLHERREWEYHGGRDFVEALEEDKLSPEQKYSLIQSAQASINAIESLIADNPWHFKTSYLQSLDLWLMDNQAFLRQAGADVLAEITSEEGKWHYGTMAASVVAQGAGDLIREGLGEVLSSTVELANTGRMLYSFRGFGVNNINVGIQIGPGNAMGPGSILVWSGK